MIDNSPQGAHNATSTLHAAVRDLTTGLLLEHEPEPSPELKGPLRNLRRQLNQLQAPQQVADVGGYGRSDSTGPHTLKLLQPSGTTTQLLAPTARSASHRMSGRGGLSQAAASVMLSLSKKVYIPCR